MENNKNKKSVKFQGDVLKFCDFIQVFVFTRNHHLKDNSQEPRVFGKQMKSRSSSCETQERQFCTSFSYFYIASRGLHWREKIPEHQK